MNCREITLAEIKILTEKTQWPGVEDRIQTYPAGLHWSALGQSKNSGKQLESPPTKNMSHILIMLSENNKN